MRNFYLVALFLKKFEEISNIIPMEINGIDNEEYGSGVSIMPKSRLKAKPNANMNIPINPNIFPVIVRFFIS